MGLFEGINMITELIIGINILMFILQIVLGTWFTELMMFVPGAPLELWRWITSMFVHGSFMHILFNMYAIYIFGKGVERKGRVLFLKIFFVSGIAGSVLYMLTIMLGLIPPLPALGASAAVYGILGAFVVFYPNVRLYSLIFPFGLKGKYVAILFALFEFITMFSDDGIGHAAHLGGLVIGYFIARKIMQDTYTAFQEYKPMV